VRIFGGVEVHRPLLCHELRTAGIVDIAVSGPAARSRTDREESRDSFIWCRFGHGPDKQRVRRIPAMTWAIDHVNV
jgi:hypothetical protein